MRFLSGLATTMVILLAAATAQNAPVPSPGNPVLPHIFAADPSAHVWPNDPDTLWLYTSHDQPGTNSYDTMADYHAFSTKDLVHWTDHGRILGLENVSWAASHAWAPDAVFHKGKYYLAYPIKEKNLGVFMVGMGVSERPEGPFTDIGFIKGSEWGQDPAIFIDDDGKPYLFWGHDYLVYGARLSDDLMSVVPGTKVELTRQLKDCFEGPWINKINGRYYLSYAGAPGHKFPESLSYATSDSPLGPYKSEGEYLKFFGMQSFTVHGSVVNFKGKWIAFYHSAWGSAGNPYDRSLMADFLTINSDGRWKELVPTSTGVSGGRTVASSIWLEAENGKAAGGDLIATRVESSSPGFSGAGYVTGFPVKPGNDAAYFAIEKDCRSCTKRASVGSVKVLAQVAYDQQYRLKVRYAADQDTRLHVIVNKTLIKGVAASPNEVWAKATQGRFEMYDLGPVDLKAGDNYIQLFTRDNADIRIDAFELTPIYQ